MRVDFKDSIRTPIGSYRYAVGEFDPASGVLWLQAGTKRGDVTPMTKFADPRAIRGGIHLASKTYVEELSAVAVPMAQAHVPPAPTEPPKAKPIESESKRRAA